MSERQRSILSPCEGPALSPEDEKTRQVKNFYEKIQFPGRRPLEQDSLIFLRKFSRLVKHLPAGRQNIRVLDAGCGTGNTSLMLAAQFKNIEFTGIDLSSTSIARAQATSKKMGLSNVSFYEWDLRQPWSRPGLFDIVLCFGVLHHTTDMLVVLKNLFLILQSSGKLFLWVYGKYGRYYHTLNMEALSVLMSVSDDEENAVKFTREFIEKTSRRQILKDLLGERILDKNLEIFKTDPTWIADQFLNPVENLLTMKELPDLLLQAGFRMEEWIGAPKDISAIFSSDLLIEHYQRLSAAKQMILIDLILKMERYFLVLKK